METSNHPVNKKSLTFGQKTADLLTKCAGSWSFIIMFLAFFLIWIIINFALVYKWDPYPFILLNLILSTLAAIQAPVILMSQNRQTQRDRIRSEYDYLVNRKAEREIEQLKKQLDRIERKLR